MLAESLCGCSAAAFTGRPTFLTAVIADVVQNVLIALPEFAHRLRAALTLLLEGSLCARDTSQSDWEFAVEVTELQSGGLSKNAIRWLIHKGYAEHAIETTKAFGKPGRQFRTATNLLFPSPSCLVLTDAGIEFARQMSLESAPASRTHTNCSVSDTTSPPGASSLTLQIRPQWDPDTRILRVGEMIVKHFKVPAGNQELILSAFQEEGWPPTIDDPLPPAAEIDSKRRLHDAINRLNRNQRNQLIRFFGNGYGRAVGWRVT